MYGKMGADMKHAFVVDAHLGNFTTFSESWNGCLTSRAKLCLDAYAEAFYIADNACCEVFGVGGDLFHVSCPPPQLIARTRNIGNDYHNMKKVFMDGNHDIETFAELDSAIAPLDDSVLNGDKAPNVLIQKPRVLDGVLYVPFRSGAPSKWLPDVLREHKDMAQTVVLHMGLSTDRTPAYMAEHKGAIKGFNLASSCAKYGFRRAFLGDWHNPDKYIPKKFDFEAHQISTLIPATFSDAYRNVGRMAIYDSKTLELEFVTVRGPRFVRVEDVDKPLTKWARDIEHATALYVQVHCIVGDYTQAKAKIAEALKPLLKADIPIHYQPSFKVDAAVKQHARMACVAAKSAKTLGEAVQMWSRGRSIREDLRVTVVEKVSELTRKCGAKEA